MSSVGLGGGTISILFIVWKVIQYFNHRHIRSTCCGHSAEIGIDISTPNNSTDNGINKINVPKIENESI